MKKCSYCGAEYPNDAVVCAIDRAPLKIVTQIAQDSKSASLPWISVIPWGGLVFSIIVNACIVHGCLPFFFKHDNLGPGMMFWYMSLYSISGLTFIVGMPCAIFALKRGRRRLGWLGVVFALTPAPLGLTLLKAAMHLNGLKFDQA